MAIIPLTNQVKGLSCRDKISTGQRARTKDLLVTCHKTHVVQPISPSRVQQGLRDGDSAEQTEDDQQEGVEQGGDEDRRAESRNSLTKGDREDLGDENHGEHVTGSRGLVLETNGEVPQEVECDGTKNAVLYRLKFVD